MEEDSSSDFSSSSSSSPSEKKKKICRRCRAQQLKEEETQLPKELSAIQVNEAVVSEFAELVGIDREEARSLLIPPPFPARRNPRLISAALAASQPPPAAALPSGLPGRPGRPFGMAPPPVNVTGPPMCYWVKMMPNSCWSSYEAPREPLTRHQ